MNVKRRVYSQPEELHGAFCRVVQAAAAAAAAEHVCLETSTARLRLHVYNVRNVHKVGQERVHTLSKFRMYCRMQRKNDAAVVKLTHGTYLRF